MLDFYSIFIGSSTFAQLAEMVFRTGFMYVYTVLNIRLMDKRSLGMLSPYEFIIIIALGTSVGDPMFYTHVPLIQGMLVTSTIVFMERFISLLTEKSRFWENVMEGKPALIIKNGIVIEPTLKQQKFSTEELLSALRIKGIRNIGQIAYAYIEPSGNISVIKAETAVEGVSTMTNNYH